MDKPNGYWKTHDQLIGEIAQLEEDRKRLICAIDEAANMLIWDDIYDGVAHARDVLLRELRG